MMQFAPILAEHGIETCFNPLLDNRYLRGLYGGTLCFGAAFRSYARRLRDLIRSRNADVIWLEKEALPWVPALVEHALMPKGVPVVTDYDDALFHRYDQHHSVLVRHLLGHKIDKVMARSALVMAGNRYLADRALVAGAPWVETVPTVVDITRYQPKPLEARQGEVVIGWIGSPSTWNNDLKPIVPLLTAIAHDSKARLHVIGSHALPDLHPLVNIIPWVEEEEVARIQAMDIGIMPLTDTPWARGKCGYKLIQYMACGLPVVASPIGVNCEIVEHGVNGFLASTPAEWQEALKTLIANPSLRVEMGLAGRRKVESQYSLQVWGPRVAELFYRVGKPKA
ncbi:glycosyltransferase family 4 protein [Thermosynechococcus sp.]|uniref:glycosyltransferase family 4 protein n=1 Tax=Thermosynechococcus sp. TaxID=2814275 RepID=UPI00261942A3|nr:glycosyltransferase family 4 protein [Thermosynechococcus sp.]